MSDTDRRDFANVIRGPWMDAGQLERLPDVSRQFDEARDPLIKLQLQDLDKTEAQRRGEGSQAHSQLAMPQSWHQQKASNHDGTFLAAARDKAMAQAIPDQTAAQSRSAPSHAPSPSPDYSGPSR